jgi:hypothetical protein
MKCVRRMPTRGDDVSAIASRDNRIALVQHRGGGYTERARSTFPITSLGQTEREEGFSCEWSHMLGAEIEDDA